MDDHRFDELTKTLGRGTSRRAILKGLVGTVLGGAAGVAGLSGAGAEARCKVQGRSCGKNDNCCSGLCCNKVCCAAGDICDGNGFCRPAGSCAVAADCPPSAVTCQTSACINGQCGFLNSQTGTPCVTPGGAPGTCQSGACVATVSCSDGIKNGNETDVDCGGSCPNKCADFRGCLTGADCQSGFCCNGVCRTVIAEICNGLDDNCNGQVDEGLGTLTCGIGACQRTVQACVNGVPQVCTPGNPSAEICGNGIDDDCDGVVDNGCCTSPADCPPPANPCQVATCANGVCGFVSAPVGTVCGADSCSGDTYTPPATCDDDGQCQPGATVSCDDGNPCTTHSCFPGIGCQQTNDPDGTICPGGACQNGVCVLCEGGAACDTGLAGPCADGVIVCVNGQAVCQQTYFPQFETCNGIDDDCDGIVDDGPICGANATCTGAAGCQCNPGFRSCDGIFANGCETNVLSNANNCGGCGFACQPGWLCQNGVCFCPSGNVCFSGECLLSSCSAPQVFNPQQCSCCTPQNGDCNFDSECCSGQCFAVPFFGTRCA